MLLFERRVSRLVRRRNDGLVLLGPSVCVRPCRRLRPRPVRRMRARRRALPVTRAGQQEDPVQASHGAKYAQVDPLDIDPRQSCDNQTPGEMSTSLPLRCQTCGLVLRAGASECPFRDTRKSAGSILLQEGVRPESVVYLRRGQVVLSSSAASGSEVSCAVRGPDTMLGLELLLDRPMPYQVWALSDVVYCSLDRVAAEAWIGERKSPAGAALTYSLEESARRIGERQALQGSALRRAARFLLQQCEAAGSDEPITTPHRVLAGMLGMRPETLSRALAQLRTSGMLVQGRAIQVADVARLRALAD